MANLSDAGDSTEDKNSGVLADPPNRPSEPNGAASEPVFPAEAPQPGKSAAKGKPARKSTSKKKEQAQSPIKIDKSTLTLSEPRRVRDKEHLKFVAQQACMICGRQPSDAHHVRFAQPRALGRKVSDEFTVPLCRTHHREVHRFGDEASWWQKTKLEPLSVAATLWRTTHPNR